MIGPAIALLAAVAAGARALYPRAAEARAARRSALGPDGIIVGAATLHLPRPNAPGALVLHGGGDTPQAVAELARHLHREGYSVRAPLLPGHGRALSALLTVSADDLHRFVLEEYDAMRASHEHVAVVGLSMGGALSLRLALTRDVPALVLLAPYVDMPVAIRRLAATAAVWGWVAPYFSSRGERSIRDPIAAAKALGHGIMTPAMLRALHGVVEAAADALPRVKSPTLVIQSREDNRISVESAERAFDRLGAAEKRIVWTEGAGHVITVDYGREQVFELCAQWLGSHVGPAS